MKSNILIMVIVTIFLLAGGYWYFVVDEGSQASLSTSAPPNAAQTQFDALVSQLQPITFDTSIFSDPRFNALVNITTPVSPESPGRIDPLAAFSAVASAPAAPTASAPNAPAPTGGAPSGSGAERPATDR